MSPLATVRLTDAALEEALKYAYYCDLTGTLLTEYNPLHRLAMGVLLSIEKKTEVTVYSSEEKTKGDKDEQVS